MTLTCENEIRQRIISHALYVLVLHKLSILFVNLLQLIFFYNYVIIGQNTVFVFQIVNKTCTRLFNISIHSQRVHIHIHVRA